MNQEIINRGQAAKNVVELPDFKLLVEEVRKDIFAQWTRTNVDETAKREQLHVVLTGLELLVGKAKNYVEAANFELAREASIPDA